MCRLAAYTGPAMPIENIVSAPDHSLLRQSLAAKESAFTVNGDGFGVCWYGDDHIPGQYRDILPAWSDTNLASFCRLVQSELFMAHIRASTNGETSRVNCHPFVYEQWSYMHNGQIPHIQRLRRELEYELSDDLFNARYGTTDSELFFLLLLSNGFSEDAHSAWKASFERICIDRRHDDDPVRMTCVLSDGEKIYAFRQSSDQNSPTLYLNSTTHNGGVALASEPLDQDSNSWTMMPEDTLCIIQNRNYDIQKLTH